jgi:hypothetical protein
VSADRQQFSTAPQFTGFDATIAKILGLEGGGYVPPTLEPNAIRVARELGLGDAAILPAHADLLTEIAAMLPDAFRPLSRVSAGNLKDVWRLVERLPQTHEAVEFLGDTINGVAHHTL